MIDTDRKPDGYLETSENKTLVWLPFFSVQFRSFLPVPKSIILVRETEDPNVKNYTFTDDSNWNIKNDALYKTRKECVAACIKDNAQLIESMTNLNAALSGTKV